jgi:mannose-6-phosphate isomerase-like protein (cupin superfamily)
MKVVQRGKARSLKGHKSLSYQLVGPRTGSRKFLLTVVHVDAGGITPVHEHESVDSAYYILEGRGEVSDGKTKKAVGPETAIFFPAGSSHGIRNVGRGRLVYVSCHAPPYEIEELYREWSRSEKLMSTGG